MILTVAFYRSNMPIKREDLMMALLSELVATCEAQKIDTGATLNVFARRLREAGRISKAGRGRGAAHMSFLDAARFLIACAATDHPERAADAEFVFSNFVWDSESVPVPEFQMTKDTTPTLDTALAKALELLADGTLDTLAKARSQRDQEEYAGFSMPILPPIMWLILRRNGGGAELRVMDGRYWYRHPALAALSRAFDEDGGGPPAQKVAIQAFERETHRFQTGKNLVAEFQLPVLRAVADLVAGKVERKDEGGK